VVEGTGDVYNTAFQYTADLYYWTGSSTNSGSVPDFVLAKYPNRSNVGIFDVSRILNSTLQDLAIANTSNIGYFACEFYGQYISGSSYVTGSRVRSSTYKYADGYGVFQEPIGQEIYSKTPYWPLMTDGPATQSCFDFNYGYAGVYAGSTGTTVPTKLVYTTNLGTFDYTISGSTNTAGQVIQYPIGLGDINSGSLSAAEYYSIQAYNNATPLGQAILYEVTCTQKYPNIRIKWKNRYGQFDYYNFNMINRQSFNVNRAQYQPQLGTWSGTSLAYADYDSGILNYLVDANQAIQVNTYFVPESYNDIFKELMVSDEIYWVYNEAENEVRPITIKTSNVAFKTGVVDKLIQYTFDFDYGQQYKLLI
jgi:hypothetical protein